MEPDEDGYVDAGVSGRNPLCGECAGATQKELALQFSRKGVDRWAGVDWQQGATGLPLLDGAIATFECRSRGRHDAGDHVILVGEVERCSYRTGVAPLLYHGGQFYTEHPL